MRDFGADLVARWPEASSKIGDLTLEFLAFAEGRFLTIHPFTDFNGRTIRLFLLELFAIADRDLEDARTDRLTSRCR